MKNKKRLITSQLLLIEIIASGATTKEISQELGISENTTKLRIKKRAKWLLELRIAGSMKKI